MMIMDDNNNDEGKHDGHDDSEKANDDAADKDEESHACSGPEICESSKSLITF